MALSYSMRTALRWALAATAIACVTFAGLSILATLAAGTLEMDGDYPDGAANLFVSSISVVRFKGIIPFGSESKDYQLKLLWFLNAFGWEWPTTVWDKSCGIVHNINGFFPGEPLTLPEDLGLVAARLRLPQEDYACLDKYTGRTGLCHNEFLAAWDAVNPRDAKFDTTIPLFLYYFAGIFMFHLGVQEIAAKWFPGLLACHCPNFISKRNWCSCLKDGEELTPDKRNSLRITVLTLLSGAYAAATLALAWKATTLVRYLNEVDVKVGGMDAHVGHGFLWLSAITLFAILLSVFCLKIRARIGKKKSWMEEQIGNEVVRNELDNISDDEIVDLDEETEVDTITDERTV